MDKKNNTDLFDLVNRLGGLLTDEQAPQMLGRVLGWLLLNSPNPQSAEMLADALKASRGAISMSTRTLMSVGLVTRRSFPGDRRAYYQVHPETLTLTLRARFASLAKVQQTVEEALVVLADEPPERLETLTYIRDMYAFLSTELPRVLDDWQRRVERRGAGG